MNTQEESQQPESFYITGLRKTLSHLKMMEARHEKSIALAKGRLSECRKRIRKHEKLLRDEGQEKVPVPAEKDKKDLA
jgi:hypothetical protein